MSEFLIAHVGHTLRSHEHVTWWNPDHRGYTVCTTKAGRYSEDEARRICADSECLAVPVAAAIKLARSTPYYRRSDGNLARLYDGGQLAPVENSREVWKALQADALVVGRYAKPTPMAPTKARAVYLPDPVEA